MSAPIGFVLLINPFNPLEQTARLIQKLNRMFSFPPIACHHDFSKNPAFLENYPANVFLVRPHVETKWADFSCIEAATRALRLLYSDARGPDWFIYVSGSDYPIKPAERVLRDLQSSEFDAYIEHRLVTKRRDAYPLNPECPENFKGSSWLASCHWRYCSMSFRLPWITKRLSFTRRTFRLQSAVLNAWTLPFSEGLKCYAGEAWFCGNRRAAAAILDAYDRDSSLINHYKKVPVPEESYFQTVLGNAPNLTLSQESLRYIDWSGLGNHPKILTLADLPMITRSHAHFARKFDPAVDAKVLDVLDEHTEPGCKCLT